MWTRICNLPSVNSENCELGGKLVIRLESSALDVIVQHHSVDF
jgi:hypothetical protein